MMKKVALYACAFMAGITGFLGMGDGWPVLVSDDPTIEELLKLLVSGVWWILTAFLVYTGMRINLPLKDKH